MLNLWQKNGVFKIEIIQPLLDMAAGASNAVPVAESVTNNEGTVCLTGGEFLTVHWCLALSLCLFVLSYSGWWLVGFCFIVFYFILYMPVCFPMRDKKSVNSERGSREDLGRIGKKTIIRLYYIKKLDFFFKKKENFKRN